MNATVVAEAPKFSASLARLLVSEWQVAGIYRFSSGAPFSVQDGTDQELSGISHQRPNLTGATSVYSGQTCGGCLYLNKSAFAPQALGTVGNLGWNSVNGPSFRDVDLALSRNFRLAERRSLQVRADAFNIGNNFVPSIATTAAPISPAVPAFAAWNSAQFSQILSAWPTRKIQFALKYTF